MAKLCVPLRLPLCSSAFKKVTNLCKAVLSEGDRLPPSQVELETLRHTYVA
ncbi:hypothetical protein [Nostoc sp.]|uniref:hypothetical protein n=1 Tax=Nostoc sp. TaxID=1180 RepID=UPI002FF0BC67